MAVILVVCIFLYLARRRRRRREKEAMLASGPLDWWRQTDILPRLMNREPSESSTIKADVSGCPAPSAGMHTHFSFASARRI